MSNIYGFYKQKHQSTWVTVESKNKSFYSQGHKGIKSGLAGKLFQNIKSITLYIQPSLNVRTDLLLYIQRHRIYCHELLWDFNRFLAPSSVKKWMCCKIMNVKSLRGKLHTSVLHYIQVWFPPAIPKKTECIPEDFCAILFILTLWTFPWLQIQFINYLNVLE